MILIVDDLHANILALQKILELHGLPVDTADSGEDALRKILKKNYSLIIMDVQMPGMDGFEVVETLAGSNRTKDIPVIFLSAINKQKRYISRGYETGAVDYITKPVDPDLLILKVKTFLKLYEQKNELKNIRDVLSKEVEIRKQAQESLAAQMEELRSILRSLPEIAFTLSKEGKIEFVNDHWYSYSRSLDVFPEHHPDDVACESWREVIDNGIEYSCEMRLKKVDSTEYNYFRMKVVPVNVGGVVKRWVGTLTDIQKQKLANELLENKVVERTAELLAKNEELEFRNHELQQFSWVVSHDLKEPIRKIEMFVKLIQEKYLIADEKAEHYADRTVVAAERMAKLIDDLIEYARLSSNTLPEKADLNEVIREVLADFDYLIENKNAVVNCQEMPAITCIPSQLRQVFQNLISNALKFSRAGVAPIITICCERIAEKEIDSIADENGEFCRITVSDNGIGFDERYLQKIFIIFQSLNDRSSYEGTGIGLAIAKKIIEKHNGLISAKSEPGKGSQFILILPV